MSPVAGEVLEQGGVLLQVEQHGQRGEAEGRPGRDAALLAEHQLLIVRAHGERQTVAEVTRGLLRGLVMSSQKHLAVTT